MHGPFDMGRGRNGPRASGIPTLGQGHVQQAAPYRIDMSDEDFHAVKDVAVCTLAPPREKSRGGIELPTQLSPFHIVMAVGPKVAEVLGVELEVGDTVAIEGAAYADTLAGRVWFVRADKILSVVTKRAQEADTLPPSSDSDPPVEDENLRSDADGREQTPGTIPPATEETQAIYRFEAEGGSVPPAEPDGAA